MKILVSEVDSLRDDVGHLRKVLRVFCLGFRDHVRQVRKLQCPDAMMVACRTVTVQPRRVIPPRCVP